MKNKTPIKIEREILFRNQSACCVCGKSNVQIHHIDGDNKNYDLSNLCVLCIEHHALASSKSYMTKGLSPDLLKKYKSEWEGYITRTRRQAIKRRPRNKFKEEMIKFEIKKIIYNLPTEKNKKEIDRQIDYLYHLHLFEGYTKEVFKELSYIRWFLPAKHMRRISERIFEFFWQFIDLKEVPLNENSEKDFNEAISLLAGFAECNFIIEPDKETLKGICAGLLNLFKTVAIYKKKQIGLRIINALEKIEKEVLKDIKNKREKEFFRGIVNKTQREVNFLWKRSKKFSIIPPSKLLIIYT